MSEELSVHSVASRPSMKASIRDGMFASIMATCAEQYFSTFAIFLRATSLQIGLLSSIPPLIGSLSQLIGVWLMELFKNRRLLVVTGASIQALSLIPLTLIAWFFTDDPHSVWYLISASIIYYGAICATQPSWNSLIGDLVPVSLRGEFFGLRNRRNGMITVGTLILSGLFLQICTSIDRTALSFGILFIIAALSRVCSAYWLSKHEEPPLRIRPESAFSFFQFIKRAPKSNFAKFVIFVGTMNFAVGIATPYFSVYMLNDLELSYIYFTGLSACSIIAQFFSVQSWGKVLDYVGAKRILGICGVGMCTVPFLWLLSANYKWLVIVQLIAGFSWAGYNLASSTFLFDAVTPEKRGRCFAYQAIVSSSMLFIGSLFGSLLIDHFPFPHFLSHGISTPDSPILRVIALSGILRFTVLGYLFRHFEEVREVKHLSHKEILFRVAFIRPNTGVTIAPVETED